MKTIRNLSRLFAAVSVLAVSSNAFASTDTWTGVTGGDWVTTTNWSDSPSGTGVITGDSLVFGSGTTGTQALGNTLTSGINIAGITFNSGTGTFTMSGNSINLTAGITNSSGHTQTFSETGGLTNSVSSTFTVGSTNAISITTGLTDTGTAGLTTTVNGAGGTLTLSSLTLNSGASGAITDTFNGTGNIAISSTVTNGSAFANGLTYGGSGTMTISNINEANSYSGATTVSGGGALTLNINDGSVGGVNPNAVTYTANGSTLNTVVNSSGSAVANYLGTTASTLALSGGVFTTREAASSGGQSQTFASLNLGAGASQLALPAARLSSSGVSTGFSAVSRNAGGLLDISSSNNSTSGTFGANNIQMYALNSGATVLGYLTYAGDNWLKPATNATTANAPFALYTASTAGTTTPGVTTNDYDIQASNTASWGSSTVNTLHFNTATAATLTMTAANTLTVTQGGILMGSTVGTNNSTITGGSITSGNGTDLILINNDTAGTAGSPTTSNGNLIVNSNITGAIGITAAATTATAVPGQIQLGGTNTFSAASYIDGATVVLTSAGAWNGNSALNFAPSDASTTKGTFALNGNSITVNGLATTQSQLNPIVENAIGASVGNATLTVAGSATGTYTGTLQDGTGGGTLGLTLTNGTLTLTGTNTNTGVTTVNGGTLVLGNNLALQNSTLSTSGAGVINTTGFTTPTIGGLTGSTNLASVITTGYSAVTSLTLNPQSGISDVYSGVIADGAAGMTLTKTGTGTQTLSGANTYTGNTTISAGVLQLGNAGTAGSLSTTGAIVDNATLIINRTNAVTQGTDFSGAAISGSGAFIQAGSGTTTLNAANSYTGATTITNGVLNAATLANGASNSAIGASAGTAANLVLNGGTLQYTGTTAASTTRAYTLGTSGGGFDASGTVAGTMTISGNMTASGSTGTQTLSLTGSGVGTTGAGILSGTINNGTSSNVTAVTKTGIGTWILSGANAYTGTTTISAGNLQLGNAGTTGTLAIAGSILDNGTFTINRTNAVTQGTDFSTAGITGSGAFVQAGTGTTTLNATNTYGGGTTISAGTLKFALAASLPSTGTVTVSNVGTLAIAVGGAGQFSNATSGTGSIGGVLGAASFTSGSTFSIDTTSGGVDYAGVIAGSGLNLTKLGVNTLTLSGANTFTGATTISAGALQLGDNGTAGSLASTGTIVDNATLSFDRTNAVTQGTDFSSAAITGTGGVFQLGSGTLTFNAANTYSGATSVNGGTLALNFAAGGAPTTNIIKSTNTMNLNGGTLQIIGATTAGTSQTFGATNVQTGGNVITAAPVSGANLPTVALGTLTGTQGGLVEILGAAYNSGASSGTTLGAGTVAATAAYTATTNTGTSGLISNTTSSSGSGAYATVGLYDWAAISTGTAGTATAGTVVGGSQVAGFYTTESSLPGTSAFGANIDLTGNATFFGNQNITGAYSTIRFNAAGALTLTTDTALSPNEVGGLLVTPNVGANNVTIAGATAFQATRSASAATGLTVWQNNTAGELVVNSIYANGANAAATGSYTQGGPGTVLLSAVNSYTGVTYLDGGETVINAFSGLGGGSTPATLAALNLAGGTVVGNATTVSTDYTTGPVLRAVNLSGAGGGLAATAGSTMTVGGLIETTSGFGPLVIGIPASAANGSVAGLLPGTGTGTPNAAVNATGTVSLTNANGYIGGTIIDSGTLQINGGNALGGANYGGLTFNGGTLQYAATITNGTTDLSIPGAFVPSGQQAVTLASGGGKIDTNGNTVTYSQGIGNGGSGSLTVVDTGSPHGSLTLGGAGTYSGGTTVNNNGSLIVTNSTGSATGSGGVSVGAASAGNFGGTGISTGLVTVGANGIITPGVSKLASGTLTVGSLTFAVGSVGNFYVDTGNASGLIAVTTPGGLTLTGGVIDPYITGTNTLSSTVGTYNLISYTGSFTGIGGLTTATAPAGITYTLSNTNTTNGDIVLTIAAGTPNLWNSTGGGSWNIQGNWDSGTAVGGPNGSGVAVVFGGGTTVIATGGTVNIAGPSIVAGSLTFSNSGSYTISATAGQTLTLDNSGSSTAINLTAGNHTITAPVIVNTPGVAVTVGSGEKLTWSGNVSGGGTVTINGPGTTLLSGTNTYGPAAGSVGTIFNSGVLQVGGNSALSTGDVSITGNNTIQPTVNSLTLANKFIATNGTTTTFDTNGNTLTLSGNLSDNSGNGGGTGAFTVASTTSGGTLILTGATNNSGGTITINSGATLQVGSGAGSSISSTAPIVDSGALVFNSSSTTLAPGAISGAGTLAQSGTGTVTLNNTDTLNGATTISSGTLVIGTALALENSTVNYNGGSLKFSSPTAATFGALSGSVNLALTNATPAAVTLTTGGNGATTTYSGALSGAGSLVMQTGTMNLTGANTYTGTTTVNSGTLTLTNALGTSGTPSGNIGVNGGVLNLNGATVFASQLSNNTTGAVNLNGGSVTLSGALNASTSNVNNVNLISLNSGTLSAGSIAMGRGSLVLTGVQTAGNNTQGIYVNGATLTVTGTMAVGTSNSGNTASNNVMLNAGSVTVGGITSITNFAGSRYSLLDVNGGTFTESDTGTGILLAGTADTSTLDAELLVSGTGTLITPKITLNGNLTTANGGNSVFMADGGTTYIGTGGIVLVAQTNTTEVVDLGVPLSVGSAVATAPIIGASGNWSSAAPITLTNSSVGSGSVAPTIQAADSVANSSTAHNITLSGAITGTGGLNKTGGGTLILSGTGNTYSGGTTINAGTVNISGINNVGGGSYGGLTFNGGTLQYTAPATGAGSTDLSSGTGIYLKSGTATIDTNGNGFGGTVNGNGNVSGAIDYANSVGQSGSGGLTLNDSNANPGVLEFDSGATYTGATIITSGTLYLDDEFSSNAGNANDLSNSSGVNLNGTKAIFDISGGFNQTIKDLTGIAGSTIDLGSNSLTAGTANSTVFAGVIKDGGFDGGTGGMFVKTGTGTITLTGANTYTGGTTIGSGGALQVGNGSTTGNLGIGGITDNGKLVYNRTNAMTEVNAITGGGSVTQAGTGATTFNQANTYTNGTTVNAGTLYVNNTSGSGTGSGTVMVNSGGTLAGSGKITSSGVTIGDGGKLSSGPVQTGAPGVVTGPGITFTNTSVTLNGDAPANLTFSLGTDTTSGLPQPLGFAHPSTNSTYMTLSGSSTLNFAVGSIESVTLVDLTATNNLTLRQGTPYLLVTGSVGDITGLITVSGSGVNAVYSIDGSGYVVGVLTAVGVAAEGSFTGVGNAGNLTGADFTTIGIGQVGADGMTALTGSQIYADPVLYLNGGNLEVVPEPGTWALMLGGLAALILIRRARRTNS